MRAPMVVALAALAVCGCPRTSDVRPPLPRSPLSPGAGGAAPIDVHAHEARPKLAIIRREGDPAPSLVIAVAGGEGPAAHAALSGLLAARLSAKGVDVDVRSDGIGVRAASSPNEDDVGALLAAWVQATGAPVTTEEVAAANARVEALRAAPLSSPVLEPVAACAGDPAALSRDLKPVDRAGLEALRRRLLVMERTAVAVVGAEGIGEAASEAMAEVDGWPRGKVVEAKPAPQKHGAFFSGELPVGDVRLHVAVNVGDAVSAVGAAHRLRGGPPLSTKLDALEAPWSVGAINAVALPTGGCLRVVLSPRGPVSVAVLGQSAARAVAAVRREVALQSAIETDPFVVTREIVGAGSARDTAERAAWWALSASRKGSPAVATALEVGAFGREPLAGEDGNPVEEAVLNAKFGRSVRASSTNVQAVAERRKSTEIGQGQLWVMVASPCPLRHEGQWDAGMTALAATAAAAQSADPTVTVEPWVSADGAGVIAHSALLDAKETPEQQARRVASAAAKAYATVPHDANAFARAQRLALGHTGTDVGEGFFVLARRAMPDHPSWIAPWGSEGRLAATSLVEIADHWRSVLHGPARVAVINNRSEGQAKVAGDVIDHWLLPEAAARACDQLPSPSKAQAGSYDVEVADPFVMVAVPYVGPSERPFAALTAALLGDDAVLRPDFRVRLVGGAAGGAVILTARVPAAEVQSSKDAAVERLTALASKPPDAAALKAARARQAASLRDEQQHPRRRIVDVWMGPTEVPEPDAAGWAAWLSRRRKELVAVTTK